MSLRERAIKKAMEQLVTFKYVNSNHLHIDTSDSLLYDQLWNHFSVQPRNFFHMPKYRAGIWDGYIRYFDKLRKTLPIGLIMEAVEYIRKFHKDKKVSIDTQLKDLLFNQELADIQPEDFSLNFKPYPHQIKAIRKALYHKRAAIRAATSSGKSYMIACMANYLHEKMYCYNWLIVVPNIQLVEQFFEEMKEYGLAEKDIGRIHMNIYNKEEQLGKKYVISTWQTLMQKTGKALKYGRFLEEFDGLIIDEAHGAKANELKSIILACKNAKYRLGLTGTLPTNSSELYSCIQFLGPQVLDIPPIELIETGYAPPLKIYMLWIEYPAHVRKTCREFPRWEDVKAEVMMNPVRLDLIKKICENTDKNILILIHFLDREGEPLSEWLRENLPWKRVEYIHGKRKVKEREEIRHESEETDNMVIVATYGTFKQGINIKNLHDIVLGSSLKSDVSILQSIGRGFRLYPDKKLTVWDLCDEVKYLKSHARERAKIWERESFTVKNYRKSWK